MSGGLGVAEGASAEKEVDVFGSVTNADEALEVLVKSLRLGAAHPAVEVAEDVGGIWTEEGCDVRISSTLLSIPFW